jgi:hypothetical protein
MGDWPTLWTPVLAAVQEEEVIMSTGEQPALRVVPEDTFLEDRIRLMRRCQIRCPMVATLDQRVARQRALVQKLLARHGLSIDELLAIPLPQLEGRDEELQLWYHVLRDCDYIDSLR